MEWKFFQPCPLPSLQTPRHPRCFCCRLKKTQTKQKEKKGQGFSLCRQEGNAERQNWGRESCWANYLRLFIGKSFLFLFVCCLFSPPKLSRTFFSLFFKTNLCIVWWLETHARSKCHPGSIRSPADPGGGISEVPKWAKTQIPENFHRAKLTPNPH